ncbi:hypothetical protein ACL7TT_15690 [Microbulbifer sp. 2304DJ12-6]|uniref:hypothetical protein n=1 Tax=Microbulbifer sp. 2304DJ12-6 TaxID=3233340 RepID=UPI0039B094F1
MKKGYDTKSEMKSIAIANGSEICLLNLINGKSSTKTSFEGCGGEQGVIRKHGKKNFYLQISQSFDSALFYYINNNRLYLGQNILSFLQMGVNRVDLRYLIEMEYFGFSIDRKCLLMGVRMLFPGDCVSVNAKELIWLEKRMPKQGGFHASLLEPQGHKSAIYNLLPRVASLLLSPFDNVFLAKYYHSMKSCNTNIFTVKRSSLPGSFYCNRKSNFIFNKAHKNNVVSGIDIKGHALRVLEFLNLSWNSSGCNMEIEEYIDINFNFPFKRFLLNILASNTGTKIRIVDSHTVEPTLGSTFSIDDNSIANIYDSFQRIFFYGNQWLARNWFFIPPMISAKLIKLQYKHCKDEHRIYLFTLTLDYLLRFYNLKVHHTNGD